MKFVVFEKPDYIFRLEGYGWLQDLMEDKNKYEFVLVEAKNAIKARETAAEYFYKKDLVSDLSCIVSLAFYSFSALEFTVEKEDEELIKFFGEKDAAVIKKLYDKYTFEAIFDEKIKFYDLEPEDRESFENLNPENLKKLYIKDKMHDVLVFPITKEIK